MAAAIASAEASGGSAMPAMTAFVMRATNARRSSMKVRTAVAIFGLCRPTPNMSKVKRNRPP